MIGQEFGEWTVIGNETVKNHRTHLLCRCSCGLEKLVQAGRLKNGIAKRCKKCSAIIRGKRMEIHGESQTRLYNVWEKMLSRVRNKNHIHYHRYGGRGIGVCSEWLQYVSFRDWAMENGYKDNLEIDRIDNEVGYFPDNCRFVTSQENKRNKRNNRSVIAFGETKLLCEWAEDERCLIKNHGGDVISNRIKRGWTPEMAIITPGKQNVERYH